MSPAPKTATGGDRQASDRNDATGRKDPLEELNTRLQTARRLAERGDANAESASDSYTDPLAELEQRIRDASDPAQWAELLVDWARVSAGPLGRLIDSIRRARLDSGQVSAVDSVDITGADQPLETLRERIADEIEAIGGRREPLAHRNPTRAEESPGASSSTNTSPQVADELLSALAARPLPGEARAEAARRLAAIAGDPGSEDVRKILELLIHGEA